MTVTKIEAVDKNRNKVYVDEQFAFVLYKSELSRYQLQIGTSIEESFYQMILREVVLKRAKLRALHLLNTMGRTEIQLRQKLEQNYYSKDIIEQVITYVKSFGYINDEEYARSFIDSRKDKKSKKEIYIQLSQKGINKDLLDKVFEEYYDKDDSRDAIRKILEKKKIDPEKASPKDMQKILGYLVRKGFSYDDIRQVIYVSEWNA